MRPSRIRTCSWLLALAWALVAPRALHAAPAALDDRHLVAAIDAYMRPLVERGDLSGQFLLLRGDRVLAERSFGWANAELRAPMTPATRLNIASMTKPMTVTIAIHAIEAHRLAASDSIARWLPDFPHGDRITVLSLLRHRSGIPHEIVPDSLATQPRTAAQMTALAARLPLDFEPGTKSSYSSGGFTVLARVLELATGASYDSLLAREITGPLGMVDTRDADGSVILPGRAAAYLPGAHGRIVAPYQDFSGLVGAGSVWSTARDMHRFVRAVVTGRMGESVRASFLRGGKLDFDGRTSGFRSFATYDSASALEAIWLGNDGSGACGVLKHDIPRLAAGERVTPPAPPALAAAAPADSVLRRCAGDYTITATGTRLHVALKDGTLWSNDWVLLPTADGDFWSPRDYGRVRPVAGPDGHVTRLDWTENGEVYAAPRVEPGAAN